MLLEAFLDALDPDGPKEGRGLQQECSVDSWFVPRGQAATLLPHLARLRMESLHEIVDTHGHVDCCYFGELGWTPHNCYHKHSDLRPVELDDQLWELVPTVESYMWEGNVLDCSIGEPVFADLPSTFIQERSELVFDDKGPCWLDAKGKIVFTSTGSEIGWRNRALLVRSSWLQEFLVKHSLEIVIGSWFERCYLDAEQTRTHRYENVYSAARVDAKMKIHLAEPIRTEE